VQVCPKCRAILEPGTRRCPYCGTGQAHVLAPSPAQDAAATTRVGMWLIGLNLALYLAMILADPSRADAEGIVVEPSWEAAVLFGASEPDLVTRCGQYWRLLTAVFVHLGLLHLVLNCVSIFILTPIAAANLGADRTTCIYLATGVLAALASHLAGYAGAGASGAVCGLIGALALYGHRRGILVLRNQMLYWAALLVAWGLVVPGIGNVAHAAGFAAGAGLGWVASAVRARGGTADRLWRISAFAASGAAIATAAAFLLPLLLRAGERNEIERFRERAASTARQIARVLDGEAAPDALPDALPEAPGGTGPVREAAAAAIAAARERSAAAPAALLALEARMDEWEARVSCSHAILWRSR
jgi:rhomboid protease GluP